jgi:hypothetical protein
MDNLTLFEIKDGLSELMDANRWAVYNFEMELQSALLDMSLNGIPIDEHARRKMVSVFTKQSNELQTLLHELLTAVGYYDYYIELAVLDFAAASATDETWLPRTWEEWLALPLATRRQLKQQAPEELAAYQKALKELTTPFNPNSPTQKLRLFYHFFGSPDNLTVRDYTYPPPWLKTHGIKEYKSRNTKGEYVPAADREALERIIKSSTVGPKSAYFWAAPFAHICLEIADLTKALGFLNCRLEAGYFRASFGAVTETGRLASRQNVQGYGCFPPGAEALTETGWKRLENIQSGELVMQSDAFGTLSWAPAEPYETHFTGNLHCVRTEQIAFSVTPKHRILMQNHKGDPYVCWAETLFKTTSACRVTTTEGFVVVGPEHKSYLPYNGPVYCLTVPSSYFLARQHGKVFVTGNSNAQNITPKLRHILTCPKGTKLAAPDYEQIESRNVGAICFTRFGADAYLNASECGDLHTLVASMVWRNLDWPEEFTVEYVRKYGAFPKDLLKAAKAIANKPFYRHFSYRDAVKRLGHGCLTADHEVLTPSGWVPISEKPPVIMQRNGTFAEVSNWIDKPYTGSFVEWEGTAISIKMTGDHRVYYTTDQRSTQCKAALRVPKSANIELSAYYQGGSMSEPLAALYAAYHCDGEYPGYNKVRFNFHKERKILRLIALADALGIAWEQHDDGRISLDWRPTFHAPGWFMLQWDTTSLAAYMNELVYWDGHIASTNQCVFSTHPEWIELWQTFYRLLGKGGNSQKERISGFGSVVHRLQINNRRYAHRKSFTIDRQTTETHQVYCPTVPASAFYVRRKGKISVTGNSNYTGKPGHMAQLTHIPKQLVEYFQDAYFEAFPEISHWHQWVATQIQLHGEITTLFNRPRRFFGRPNDDATIREAVAYEPQSMAADYTNRALLKLHKAAQAGLPIELFLQKHDEIGFRFPESKEETVIQETRQLMEQHITLTAPDGTTRDWYVPTEFESGWNLGRQTESNPNGLTHPDPTRKREPTRGFRSWSL